MPSTHAVIVPIAADLAYAADGRAICGPSTKTACVTAARIAEDTPGSIVLITPCTAPKGAFKGVPMGIVMARHLQALDPNLPLRCQTAPSFDTFGEVIATAAYCKTRPEVHGAVFVVKSWHARRARMIAERIFAREGVRAYPHFETYADGAGFFEREVRERVAGFAWNLKLRARGY